MFVNFFCGNSLISFQHEWNDDRYWGKTDSTETTSWCDRGSGSANCNETYWCFARNGLLRLIKVSNELLAILALFSLFNVYAIRPMKKVHSEKRSLGKLYLWEGEWGLESTEEATEIFCIFLMDSFFTFCRLEPQSIRVRSVRHTCCLHAQSFLRIPLIPYHLSAWWTRGV